MYVIKRDGRREEVYFDKIQARIQLLCSDDLINIDAAAVAIKVINGLFPGVKTVELDRLAAEICASMICSNPEYDVLATRIAVSNLHKETRDTFSAYVASCRNLDGAFKRAVSANADVLNAAIRHGKDYEYKYFGFKTLEKSYLNKIDDVVIERPQYMLMRVAVALHGTNIDDVLETYELMSDKLFIHASPTLFNAGTLYNQMASCFLLGIEEDTLDAIYDALKNCAIISRESGGIGLHVHNVRAKGSTIKQSGKSRGLIPMLRVFNETARYVDQGGNKRPGAFAVYLEPWHADIFDFLSARRNTGKEEQHARDLFYALWIPDEFMRRVECDDEWSLMCPRQSPGLNACYGAQFDDLYRRYEREQKYVCRVSARKLWREIVTSQIETGTPFMLYKDACNAKSNQKNLGTIQCSNLCTEIIQYTSDDNIAVCNLASISLSKCVDDDTRTFNFDRLDKVTRVLVRNLNKVIDYNAYPLDATIRSNSAHRPMGIGVQGLADAFMKCRLAYDGDDARSLNKRIFERIYYAALSESCKQAKIYGKYSSYNDSPISRGTFQFEMWTDVTISTELDWETLRAKIRKYGVRNSLLIALMPTATTAQILGNTESFEAITSNIYTRRVLSGEYQIINEYLVRDLTALGLWNDAMKNRIIKENGSVQKIDDVPSELKNLYKTVWEIPQRCLIDMAADRAPFIDQSQSLNLFVADPTYAKMTSIHFYAWKRGLKTGMYYLRTKPAANAIKFTVPKTTTTAAACSDISDGMCMMCSA